MPDFDVSGKGTRKDSAKSCLLSLLFCLPSHTQWWYFGECQSEHYIGTPFFRTWRDFFPVIRFLPCISQLTLLQRMEHRRWFYDTSKLAATKRMSSLLFSFIPKFRNCLILLLRQFVEQSQQKIIKFSVPWVLCHYLLWGQMTVTLMARIKNMATGGKTFCCILL